VTRRPPAATRWRRQSDCR